MSESKPEVVCDGDVCRIVKPAKQTESKSTPSSEKGPMAGEVLSNFTKFVDASGKDVAAADVNSKLVLLYFSASWCPPCRAFSPELNTFAKEHKGDVTVVLACKDRSEAEAKEYVSHYSEFLMIPFNLMSVVDSLMMKLAVLGLPTLVVLDRETGKVVTSWGRSAVQKNPKGCIEEWKQGKHGVSWMQLLKFW